MSNRLPRDKKKSMMRKISCHPLTESNWKDFEKLFGAKGACGGCWCMYWRLGREDFDRNKGEGNKKSMKKLVVKGNVPGLLLYVEKEIAGWCSVAPREEFLKLQNSRVLTRIDEKKVWSVVCFFIAKEFRRRGLTVPFLEFVIDYCKKKGATIVEGYPLDVDSDDYPATFAYTGFYSAFRKAGFAEAERRSPTRPIMRFQIVK